MGSRSKKTKELNTRNPSNINMVTVKQLIAMEKRTMTKKQYKQLIQMCKKPKNKKLIK